MIDLPQKDNAPIGCQMEPSEASIQTSSTFAKPSIDGIEINSDCLADRGGLPLIMRYLNHSGLFPRLADVFGRYRANQKGAAISDMLRQIVAFLMDGTSRYLFTRFDEMKRDPGYAATLETRPEQMTSFHAIKHFQNMVRNVGSRLLREILR
jgi:hypothetical protein